ncbi:DUF937 domain-containing protein [Parapedobacter indicus]|uniref:DUF937 domain-containing protein n=1 Tax=Parapedobacter indicus TaxID=1477437 RepID=A0A1I3FCV0_9SPHI|nr:DUF937 domain-containing protein [Parapedobacter indicus]PPL03660.1 uncharacterized protein DUF937 [Parapedobacter indicus]SFI09019.1 protein of unknown function [Parapedobacter indicus]
MEQLLSLLNGNLGQQLTAGISKQTGASEAETQSVVSTALPALLGALQNNASNSQGAQGILQAIGSKHDGSILENISGFLGSNDTSDGNGILKHVLGNKQGALELGIAKKTGVSSGTVSKILAMLAPIVMGYLGKQSRSNNVSDGNGLNDLLGGLLGGQSGSNVLGGLLDQNGDGKLGMDDVGGLLGGFFGKK